MSIYTNQAEQPNRKYGFLFRTTNLRKARLNELIITKEFIKLADEIISKGEEIRDLDIYNISKSLFFPMLKQHLTEGFKEKFKAENGSDAYREWSHRYRTFGQATKSFSVDLFGSEEQWKRDFEEYNS